MVTKRVPRAQFLKRLQDLIGKIQGDYMNDRAPDRADKVLPALKEAFEIVVRLREKYKA